MRKSFFLKFVFLFSLLLFFYFRLKPVLLQIVPYTYDQGRDFLKVAEMIADKNPVFIGPTTGIDGIFHGAWWYYLLAIPFLIFHGWPAGFYYFMVFSQLVGFLALFYFLFKKFNLLLATLISLLLAVSPYFIPTAFFASHFVIGFTNLLFLLLITLYLIEEKKKPSRKIIFVIGFLLAMTLELEFAFGMFFIPAYLGSLLLTKKLRKIFFKLQNLLLFIFGMIGAFSLRIMFEIKNHFMQTRTFINFFLKPKYYNERSFSEIIKERIHLFYSFYQRLFPDRITLAVFTFLIIVAILFGYRKLKKSRRIWIRFLMMILGFMFFFSLFYKDNFWSNYFDGLPYIYLLIIGVLLSQVLRVKKRTQRILTLTLIILIISSSNYFLKEFNKKPNFNNGLIVQKKVVNYVLANVKKGENYCVKVYTPPVIPYTYNYLFKYNQLVNGYRLPENDWVGGRCFFIVESDPFKFRRKEWLKNNLPKKSEQIKAEKVSDVNVWLEGVLPRTP